MPYLHIRILYNDKKTNSTSYSYETDLNDNDVQTFAKQFQNASNVFWRGRWINPLDIAELFVYQTEEPSTSYETAEVTGSSVIFSQHKGMDVTRNFVTGPPSAFNQKEKIPKKPSTGKRIFIVHGRDMDAAHELANILQGLDLEPIILAEQPSGGAATIIEKLQKYSDVGYAFVLLTPDDVGSLASATTELRNRARQNVVLELGYFMGLLGRDRVYLLYKGSIEMPSDISGVSYAQFNKSVREVYWYVIKELKAAGFKL